MIPLHNNAIIINSDFFLDLGHIQLSFEYNSKTDTLKIRVWQIADLLFPPGKFSKVFVSFFRSTMKF